MDVEILSRLQFAGTIMFHYLFPPLSIGLGLVMVIFEGMWLRTGFAVWESAARFWTKIFALNFALGVASGIVMEFQFGTNWAAYSRFVGDVFGSALAAEGIFAFFLESGFLAVLVFGWDRVSRRMHFFSTWMVFLGSVFSAVWIVVANSWQQTPAGYEVRPAVDAQGNPVVLDGVPLMRAEITDFWEMVFNPSSMDRLGHVLIGCFITGAFFVMSIACFYLMKGRHVEFARRSVKVALPIAVVFSLLALLTGHHQAQKVSVTQPAKLAAMEGHFTSGPADLYLFGWPDAESGEVKYGLKIPRMMSFLVHGDADAMIPGLDVFHEDDTPPVWLPFQMYHLMVACGMFFIVLSLTSLFFLARGTLFEKRWLLAIWVPAVVLPYVANQAGWIAAEVGRQPWVVYPSLTDEAKRAIAAGQPIGRLDHDDADLVAKRGLRTSEGLSASVKREQVLWSIMMFGGIYSLLFVLYIFVLTSKIMHGPEDPPDPTAHRERGGKFFDVAREYTDPAGKSFTQAEADERPGVGAGDDPIEGRRTEGGAR